MKICKLQPLKCFYNIDTSGLYNESFTIVIYDCNDIASTIKLNYNCKALASVVNYDHKCGDNLERQSYIISYDCNMFIIQATGVCGLWV
jgi:hypothetical protein